MQDNNYYKYCNLSPEEREKKLIEIQTSIEEEGQTAELKANLWFERGLLFVAAKEYDRACCYALQNQADLEIENLQRAIELAPEKYRDMALTDSDFDSIRDYPQFHTLITASGF